MMTKVLLVVTYPLVLLAWLVNLVFGRDRLRLQDTQRQESFWIARQAQPSTLSYFSERSLSEGGSEWSAARPLTRLLCGVSRLYTPTRPEKGAVYKASADREQGIPDEVYTLW